VADDVRDYRGIPLNAQLIRLAEFEEDWLIQGLFPHYGRFMMSAESKTGKSLLATQLAMCVATGVPFLGFPVPNGPQTVHYIDAEMGVMSVQRRLRKMLPVFPGAEKNITFTILPDRAHIFDVMESIKAKLVILDPAIALGYSDENNSAVVRPLLDRLHDTVKDFGSILIVHHTGKPSREGGVYRGTAEARGSAAFGDWVDGGFNMRRLGRRGTNDFELTFIVRDDEQVEDMEITRDPVTLTYSPKAATIGIHSLITLVAAEWCAGHNGQKPSKTDLIDAIAERLNNSTATIYRRIKHEGLDSLVRENSQHGNRNAER